MIRSGPSPPPVGANAFSSVFSRNKPAHDLAEWTRHPLGEPPAGWIEFVTGRFIAGGDASLLVSPDGRAWERFEVNPKIESVAGHDESLVGLSEDGKLFVLRWEVAYEWKEIPIGHETAEFTHLAFGDGIFVAAGAEGVAAVSMDPGHQWSVEEIFEGKIHQVCKLIVVADNP